MKKAYTLFAIASVALTASAVSSKPVAASVKPTAEKPQLVREMKQAPARVQLQNPLAYTVRDKVYSDGEEAGSEEWTSLGTGKITNSFLEIFGIAASQFDVEIEETPIEGGRKFRCLPFSMEGNPFYELSLDYVDTQNYMVFYAMDNGKNYFEDFDAYGLVPFSQFVAESSWDGGNMYSTFDGETWTVPAKGVLAELSKTGNSGWYRVNSNTPLTIALPGAKDYSAAIQTWICKADIPGGVPEGKCQMFSVQGAEDAAYVKYGYLPGSWDFTMDMAEFVSLYGTRGEAGALYCGINESELPGIYTAYVATFDEEDNCRDIKSSYFFVLDDDNDNWEEAGTATWNESLYSGSYNNWPTQALTMTYEVNKNNPGRLRLVNPYAEATTNKGVSLSAPCEGHNHYIYIDATVSDQVKIEPSVTGGEYDGRGVVMSCGYDLEYIGYSPEEIKEAGYYGTLVDNKITFPVKDVLFGEKGYQNGSFLATQVPFEVTLTPKTDVTATGIKLDKTEVTVKVGETVALTATVEPSDAADNTVVWTVDWTSSDETVATVDAEGVVTAVAEGTATVTATCGAVSATCTVTVEKAAKPVEVIILPAEVEVKVGETVTLEVVVKNPLADDNNIVWASSNDAVAAVDAKGVVTAVAEGTATVTATYAGVSATCTVTVTEAAPLPDPVVTLDRTAVTLTAGETVQLTATVEGQLMTDEVPTWTSSNEAVAVVNSEGLVTAVAEGTATVTATYAGVSATCTVTVVAGDDNMIDEINAAAARGELFDLQGRRVSAQTKGIVIVRQGNKVVKAVVK